MVARFMLIVSATRKNNTRKGRPCHDRSSSVQAAPVIMTGASDDPVFSRPHPGWPILPLRVGLALLLCAAMALPGLSCSFGEPSTRDSAGAQAGLDRDHDGIPNQEDCDPDNFWVGIPNVYYQDLDQDGFGDDSVSLESCETVEGFVSEGGDCDDQDPEIHPRALEYCDGIDNDCDATTDENSAVDASAWFVDADGDGFGAEGSPVYSCQRPQGYSGNQFDCFDHSPDVHPDADELCNDFDDDCDGMVDEDPVDPIESCQDGDGDGFGTLSRPHHGCDIPEGYVPDCRDCDDLDAATHPGAPELCDGIDNNCNGANDELPEDGFTVCPDLDGDGHGSLAGAIPTCELADGYTLDCEDCDDTRDDVYLGAPEYCDLVDNDCDGTADNDPVDGLVGCPDLDGDGYGDSAAMLLGCSLPLGYIEDCSDCFDANAQVNPASPEICDGFDNDCDGVVDGDDAIGTLPWYADADSDGYGDPDSLVLACEAPSGHVAQSGDCDDGDPTIHPEALEICGDALDNDCDGAVDECSSLGDAAAIFIGESDGDQAGFSVTGMGDVDGDGHPDLLLGAPYAHSEAGAVGAAYLLLGPASGVQDLSAADVVLLGASVDSQAGFSLASAGDLNDDGIPDMVVGAPNDSLGGPGAGVVYYLQGPYESGSLALATAFIVGASPGDAAGFSVSPAGDGYDGFLVGAPHVDGAGADSGAAYLLSAPLSGLHDPGYASAVFTGERPGDKAGFQVAGAGDCNADGQADFLLGAPAESGAGTNSGAAYLVLGPASGELALGSADGLFLGEHAEDHVGIAVAGVGDTNLDGYDDLLLGAGVSDPALGSSTLAFLLLGPTTGISTTSAASAKLLVEHLDKWDSGARAVSGAGDTNLDGFADLLIGAAEDSSSADAAGCAYLVLGPVSGTFSLSDAARQYRGEAAGDGAGVGLSQAGDLDGDGYGDFLVGARGESTGGDAAGAVYLIPGGEHERGQPWRRFSPPGGPGSRPSCPSGHPALLGIPAARVHGKP